MIKVVIINYHPKYHIGDTVEVTKNEAFGLIHNGVAMMSKEITGSDTVKKNVKSTNLGADRSGKRKRNPRTSR